MPFSQKLTDSQGLVEANKVECDEFPMASMQQPMASSDRRNSLRCVTKDENINGGSTQFNNFLRNEEECEGGVADGDYFRVDFDASQVDPEDPSVRYARLDKSSLRDHDCDNDGHQFYLSRLSDPPSGDREYGSGHLTDPYDYPRDNHYALADVRRDIQLARINITRTGDSDISITIHDPNDLWNSLPLVDNRRGRIDELNPRTNFDLDVDPRPLPQTLWVERTGNGQLGSDLRITYGNQEAGLDGFEFVTNRRGLGSDPWVSKSEGASFPYCKRNPLRDNQQKFDCVFPILAREHH